MRYFVWVDFQYGIVALFLGVVGVILAYMAWASYPKRRVERSAEEIKELHGRERQAAHDFEKNPIAPFIVSIFVIIPLWSFFYFFYIWVSKSNF